MRWLLVSVALFVGCEAAHPPSMSVESAATRKPASASASSLSESPSPPGQSGKALPPQAALSRKIIYTASVDLAVEDFAPVPAQVEALAKRLGGYVSHSKITGSPGTARTGSWTLRVPADRYSECLAGARALGEVRSVESKSHDVTDEFFDLEARLRNKKQEEERLTKLLASATGKLEEVLSVEREISRVREEIELMEGRKRLLSDQIDLTTVDLAVQEIKGYVPEERPTYVTRVRRAFQSSIESLVSAAIETSILAVALAPWLPLLLVAGLLLWAWRRRRRANRPR
jgi:hypothetical protein